MDTVAEISCYLSDRDRTIRAIDQAFKEMQRIEKVFSKFDEDSEISKVNRLAGTQEVKVTREVLKLIEDSIYYSEISDGSFDITVGPLMELWGFNRKNYIIPDKNSIQEILGHVGYKNIILNRENSTIRFMDKGVKIDLGGIAKGYAVDRAKHILVSHGIKSGMVNLGGNIFAFGEKEWKIGIEDPRARGKLLNTLKLKNKAVSTSGNYERFFILNGKRYSHIINPITGEPCQGIISVTVIADSAENSDALSTAIFVMAEEKGLRFARSIKDIEVLILKEDGKIITFP